MPNLQNLAWMNITVLGHNLSIYFSALIVFLLAWFLLRLIVRKILVYASRLVHHSELKQQLLLTRDLFRPWFFPSVALLIAIQAFNLPERLEFLGGLVITSLILIQMLFISSEWIKYLIGHAEFGRTTDGKVKAIASSLSTVIITVLWLIAFLFLLDNFGFNIATIIAGLGVGGIAVGLALQSVLSDILASFSIAIDKPFEIGDFIIVGDFMGVVDYVGLKTTRIRSLGGELLIFSNKDLVASRIRNYKNMQQRRIVFSFGLTYDTDQDQLEAVPELVKEIINSVDRTRFDRAHFAKFADYSLDFEVVYYVLVPDFAVYMDIQQEINFKLRRELTKRGVSFAFPTTTLDLPEKLGRVQVVPERSSVKSRSEKVENSEFN